MPVTVDKNFSIKPEFNRIGEELTAIGRSAFAEALTKILNKRGGRSRWVWRTGDSGRAFLAEESANSDIIQVTNDATSEDGHEYPLTVERKYRRVESTVNVNEQFLADEAEIQMEQEFERGS